LSCLHVNGAGPGRAWSAPPPVREVPLPIGEHAEQLRGKRLSPARALGLPHYPEPFNPLLPCQKKLLR